MEFQLIKQTFNVENHGDWINEIVRVRMYNKDLSI